MIQSAELNELFTALSIAQGAIGNAGKNSQGHGYNYADLAECISTAKAILLENGLSVVQMMGGTDEERTLTTILGHKSGQYIGSEFVMAKAVLSGGSGKNPAQVLGSAITYMRRYAYAAIIGLAQADDDAKSLTPSARPQPQQPKAKPVISPRDEKLWNLAKTRYRENGNLDAVKLHATIEAHMEKLLIEEVESGQ